jgi:hypothetical protein
VRRFGSTDSSRATHACDWNVVWDHQQHRFLDLADPFAQHEHWKPMDPEAIASLDPILLTRHQRLRELSLTITAGERSRRPMN